MDEFCIEIDEFYQAYFQSFQDYYRLKEKEVMIRSVCEPIVNGSYKADVMAGYVTMEEQMMVRGVSLAERQT